MHAERDNHRSQRLLAHGQARPLQPVRCGLSRSSIQRRAPGTENGATKNATGLLSCVAGVRTSTAVVRRNRLVTRPFFAALPPCVARAQHDGAVRRPSGAVRRPSKNTRPVCTPACVTRAWTWLSGASARRCCRAEKPGHSCRNGFEPAVGKRFAQSCRGSRAALVD